jgi:hypothetical protein
MRRRWESNPRMTDLQSVANAQNLPEKRGSAKLVAQMVATDTAENGCERLISLAETDPDLARLVSAWSRLSPVVKRIILAALDAD